VHATELNRSPHGSVVVFQSMQLNEPLVADTVLSSIAYQIGMPRIQIGHCANCCHDAGCDSRSSKKDLHKVRPPGFFSRVRGLSEYQSRVSPKDIGGPWRNPGQHQSRQNSWLRNQPFAAELYVRAGLDLRFPTGIRPLSAQGRSAAGTAQSKSQPDTGPE